MPDLSRRRLLQLGSAVGGWGLAGCLAPLGREVGGDCRDGERWDISFRSVRHGRNEGFELAADPGTVAFGDTITFRLRNVSGETLHVGTDGQYTVQEPDDDGWRTVFSTESGIGWDGSAERVAPNRVAFTWSFTVSETGFVDARYEPCGPLTAGAYRFVYWGLPDRPPTATPGEETATHHAVARGFTIED